MTKVVFPKAKNFGALEVIRSYKVDTVKSKGRYELVKRYGLTQFDSGKYTIPRMAVLFNSKPVYTDSIAVEVSNVVVDTLKQKMFDIKPIAEAKSNNKWIWKWLLILLALAGLGAAIYWFIKRYQKKKIEEEIYKTPIEKATSLLNILEKKELWQHGEIKAYYSELTDIARNYIEEAIEVPAMESTTFELIQGLKKKMSLTKETIDNLLTVLQHADLVKFAKSQPQDFEITEDRKKIERTIVTLDKSIPVVVETEDDMLLNELQRQEQLKMQLKKKRNKRIQLTVLIVVGVICATLAFFIVTKGWDFVKDNLFGNTSKELLEGEWIYSEYGNPGVIIETPKVLKRIDLSKSLPKDGMALIKEMQSFAYGSVPERFYIIVSTIKFKKETEIDLSKALDGSLQMLESKGAQNIVIKQDEFETKEGVKGRKGYGTFTMIDPILKTSAKLYYEVLGFSQEGGLQQIIIIHEEGDQYANKISDRVLNSVELKKASQE